MQVGLTTSAIRSVQQRVCAAFGLADCFDVIVTGEDVVESKPDPEPYARTAAQLALDPRHCVVIEDSVNGVRAGKAAGCLVFGLTTTFRPGPFAPRERITWWHRSARSSGGSMPWQAAPGTWSSRGEPEPVWIRRASSARRARGCDIARALFRLYP